MNITCDIIRDLLPLYAEDMVSEDSKKLVDEHLCQCDPCTKQLAVMKKSAKMPVDVEVSSLKRVETTIHRRRILTAAAAIMTLLALVVTGFIFMLTPYVMTAEEAIEGVELREDGGLAIDYARAVSGTSGYGVFDDSNYGILCHTNRYDFWQAQKKDKEIARMTQEELKDYIAQLYDVEECTQRDWDRFFQISVDYGTFQRKDGELLNQFDAETWIEENGEWVYRPSERNHWYLNSKNGDVDFLIWDAGQENPSSFLWTVSSIYGIFFFGSMMLAGLLFILSKKVCGIWNQILIRAVILLGSIAFSILLVTGGQFTILEHHLSFEWNQAICTEAVFLSLAALLWHQLYRLNKQDKGE